MPRRRVRIASMVSSSQAITALKAQIDAGRDFAGVDDRGETENVRSTRTRHGQTEKVELLEAVASEYAHNFMHDKVVVADDTVVTGSFNFSLNATRNAENVSVIGNATLADLYATYIDEIAARYR